MALVNVRESWRGQAGSIEQGDGVGNTIKAADTIWTALYDAPTRAFVAATAAGIPAIGANHPDDADLKLIAKEPRQIGPYLIEVRCRYWGAGSPLLWAYERGWEGVESVEEIEYDYQGLQMLSTAGDMYKFQMPWSDPIYRVTRNEAVEPDTVIRAYRNTVNDDVWKGAAAYCVRMLPITADRIVNGAIYYWRVTYRMQFREDTFGGTVIGWRSRTVCEGWRYWNGTYLADGVTPMRLPFTEKDGSRKSTPGRLHATGALIGQPLSLTDNDDPSLTSEFQVFELYTPADFDALLLI